MAADADESDILLPPPGDRAWLLSALAELVRARGPAPLLAAPLVGGDARFFPDRWVGGQASVRRLLRRLVGYAALDVDRVEVEVYGAMDERTRVGRPSGKLAGVSDLWLVRAQARTLGFAVEATLLGDPIAVVAAGGRAVADAYRALHGLRVSDPTEEQRRIDVTAVYLGFGRLTADAAHRYSSRGGPKPARQGLLSPQAVAFLLAAVVVARGLDRRAIKAIADGLQANQRAFFRRAVELLGAATPALAETLGLPPPAAWPAPPALAALTAPFDDEDDAPADETAEATEDRGIVGANAGKPVFRVERRAGLRIARVLVMAAVMLGGLATRPQMGEVLTMGQVAIGALILGVVGLLVGSLFRESRCSEPKCGASLPAGASACPRCGGTIMGSIRHPRERLAAEEALQRDVEA